MPDACRCGAFARSEGEADGCHRRLFLIDPLHVWAVSNVLARLVDLHDGNPGADDESDKQNRFNDHVFDPSALRDIEDRPATVVNKI
jgi:hypothetical protein